MLVPAEVVTALETGLVAATEVAALVLIILVGIAAMRYMRRAVGGDVWLDSKGNEYSSEGDADEADRRAEGAPSAQEIIASIPEIEWDPADEPQGAEYGKSSQTSEAPEDEMRSMASFNAYWHAVDQGYEGTIQDFDNDHEWNDPGNQ
jgi:hypothetical protein